MQHLSLAEGTRLLDRVRASGARWVLATTYLMGSNKDIANGRVYWPNLCALPFNLGEPERLLEDEGGAPSGLRCRLGLWQLPGDNPLEPKPFTGKPLHPSVPLRFGR
jgi:hypothetical protein